MLCEFFLKSFCREPIENHFSIRYKGFIDSSMEDLGK